MAEYVYKKIGSITFSLFSPEDIKKMATAKIITPELYDKEGYPVDGGLMDTHLGVIDPGLRCKTCGGRLKSCTGHFGFIELARPIIHIKYIKIILDCLRSTCRDCGRVMMSEEEIKRTVELLKLIKERRGPDFMRKRTKVIIDILKNLKKCPHCGGKQYVIKLEKPTTFYERDKRLSPIEIRSRLEKIPNDDAFILGLNSKFARPEWTILGVLSIPPVTIRPSITLESGERSEDDLTHKLGDIVRINQRLFENINAGAPEIIIEDLWDLLQYHITTYFDNTITQVPPARHRSGQPLKTLTQRIKSKEGRFRHNLAGKRVNYSARTVISPDPQIEFGEVGIPKSIAYELTVPERITSWNKAWLKELVKNGPNKYPGANYVITEDGKRKKITVDTQEQILESLDVGWVVERHIVDGDISIFNRQPSLHRMSIMCHKIRVLPGKSFRLNPSVCTPYNADFDGDEMNLHIPQTEEARAEAEILMSVRTQIISPKHGKNIIGCVEDSVTGNYLLTKGMKLSKEDAVQLLNSVGVDEVPNFGSIVDGKEVFSAVLPKNFNYIGYSRNHQDCDTCVSGVHHQCKNDSYIFIKNGKLISGVIDSNSIGDDTGRLLIAFYREYGQEVTLNLVGKLFRLGIKVLLRNGFTTKISDTDLSDEIKAQIKTFIEEADKNVEKLVELYRSRKLEALPGKTREETLEVRVLELLNKIRNKIGDIVAKTSEESNPTIMMANSGAKGNLLNLAQMSALIGQQALRGQRIIGGYEGRTLPVFEKGDLGSDAHGFVKHAFKTGLSPTEFFFHAMTGRDALMDTALRTPKSGYLYRRLANALQDLKVEYDGTVRDANKIIIQFKYGEDGIDVSKSEGGSIDVAKIIKEVMKI